MLVSFLHRFIENRIEDALQLLEKIDEGAAQELSAFTYDYLRAYLSFYSQDVTEISSAQVLCGAYLEKPYLADQPYYRHFSKKTKEGVFLWALYFCREKCF